MDKVKKLLNGQDSPSEIDAYQKSPRYTGYEDYTPVGRQALRAYNKAEKGGDDMDAPESGSPRSSKTGRAAARKVLEDDDRQRKQMDNVDAMGNPAGYAHGGVVGGKNRMYGKKY